MKNKTLSLIGVGAFLLQVFASASNSSGENIAPTYVLVISVMASLFFLVFASLRLWGIEKKTILFFIITQLLTFAAPFLLTAENSSTNLVLNVIKILAFLAYFYVVFLLYNLARHT